MTHTMMVIGLVFNILVVLPGVIEVLNPKTYIPVKVKPDNYTATRREHHDL